MPGAGAPPSQPRMSQLRCCMRPSGRRSGGALRRCALRCVCALGRGAKFTSAVCARRSAERPWMAACAEGRSAAAAKLLPAAPGVLRGLASGMRQPCTSVFVRATR